MRLPALRPLPAAVLLITVLAEAGSVALSWGLEPWYDTLLYPFFSVGLAGAGALVLTRRPRHLVGVLLCAAGVENALAAELAQGWGLRAAAEGWPGGAAADWIQAAGFLPQGPVIVLLLLVFPGDRLTGRGRRALVGVTVAATAVAEVGFTLDPGTARVMPGGHNPLAVEGLPAAAMFAVGISVLGAAMAVAAAAAVRRFLRATGVERQQLKWFVVSGGAVMLLLPACAALWSSAPAVRPLPAVALTAWSVSMAVALLRYRLYDLDLVISRAVAYGALTAALAAVFGVATLVFGALAGRGSAWATAGATLAAAAVFQPLRRRLQRRVDRRFRPGRYAALRHVAVFLDELRGGRREPEEIAGVLRTAVGDPGLGLRFVPQPGEPQVDESGHAVAAGEDAGCERYALRRAGVVLGEVVYGPSGEERRALVPELADAAGLAIEMTALRVELRRRLREVEASRARIVAVADDERRRIERDLHDGAQQRLVSIGLALRHAQHELGPGAPEAAGTLDGAIAEIALAIGELRELAQGLRPALLDAGLRAALSELAARSPVPVELLTTGERFPAQLETAAYFVACEGLTNAVKHSGARRIALRAAREDGKLVVSVADDGVGGAAPRGGTGLTGLLDRVAAHGGSLRIDSAAGGGTRLRAEFPCVL
ncbi:histidine kinase [Streptomyces sp. NPDC051940]|uniref:sensor histidine kinase n=1 Tax=Streptomyces sp. NPDC051940 TaxID=3155675 RepID=UPI003432DE66